MILYAFTGHNDVIELHKQHTSQHRVHQPLECLRCPLEAKGHSQEFKQPKRGDNHSLGHVYWKDWHRMIPTHQIYYRKDSGFCQVGRKILKFLPGYRYLSSTQALCSSVHRRPHYCNVMFYVMFGEEALIDISCGKHIPACLGMCQTTQSQSVGGSLCPCLWAQKKSVPWIGMGTEAINSQPN